MVSPVSAQEISSGVQVTDSIPVRFDNYYELSSVSIVPHSEIIRIRDRILQPGEYTLYPEKTAFSLSDTLPYSILDTVVITYLSHYSALKKEYRKRALEVVVDQYMKDTISLSRQVTNPYSSDAIFGSNIEKSGSIVRGFTIGTNKDLSLQSGLRLQLSGKLSDDVEVVAALTDESTPIQPEGNTERLDELDKVFIRITHPLAQGTFGDYDLMKRYGEFGVINRKMQGLLGETKIGPYEGFVSIASARGKFNTNQFQGIDGVQGPYRLTGGNGERDIIIIAGSEKVFIDGQSLRRGENNDYIIDYSNSEVTFTPGRLITASSRITVEFEYSDRRYSRNLFGAGATGAFFGDALTVKMQVFQEGDDKDSPIDITLSNSDKDILRGAGDDRFKAAKSGVILATPDSTGRRRGGYEGVDTLIGGAPYRFYRFNPGADSAVYNVSFSSVAFGTGDYIREAIGQFRFVGQNAGDYAPLIFLPLPQKSQFGNLVVDLTLFDKLVIGFELAGSSFDANTFSTLDDTENSGYARTFSLKLKPVPVEIGDFTLGQVGVSARDRFIESRFTSLDRFNDVEFDRYYNSSGTKGDEVLREFSLQYLPGVNASVNSSIGFMKKGENFSSTRSNTMFTWEKGKEYSIRYNMDYVKSENSAVKGEWIRQRANASYQLGFLQPLIDFSSEQRVEKLQPRDTLLQTSLQFYEFSPGLGTANISGFTAALKYIYREDYFPLAGSLTRESIARGQQVDVDYKSGREINSTLRLTIYDKKYTESFKSRGSLDNQTILIRTRSQFQIGRNAATGDVFYEVSTQRSAKLERVFVKVEKGAGNYIYLGDLNNNGIADENEFQLTLYDGEFILVTIPTDELFPVTDLKAGTRWKLDYAAIIGSENPVLKAFTTETTIRVEENSTEPDQEHIYLLRFSKFLNDQHTLRGSQFFQNDLFILESSNDLSFRIRYNIRRSLNQYSGGAERGLGMERSGRVRIRLVREFALQIDAIQRADNLRAPQGSTRNREISTVEGIIDFSYRPINAIELGLKIRVAGSEDSYPDDPTIVNVNGQAVRFSASLGFSGRVRAELERNEVSVNQTQNYLPFELTGGYALGKNYLWRLNFDYRIADNLQSTASYEGRSQGGGRVIHTARAEIRAYF